MTDEPKVMKFCSDCGSLVSRKVPLGDVFARFGLRSLRDDSLSESENRRRLPAGMGGSAPALPSSHRSTIWVWTFPAGFMEQGESVEQAAARETLEEGKPT